MESIAKIRRMYHVEGKAIRAIARELGISKNTVKKIIRSDTTKFELAKYEKKKPLIGEYLARLDELLKENLKEPLRRRMTAKKLYEELQKLGYQGGYQPVNLAVRKFRVEHEAKGKQVFIPLAFEPGEAFQFDWGLEEVEIAGNRVMVKAARIKLCYSRYFLVVIYPNEQLEMVVDAHSEAFKFFGGSCKKGIYDNMKTAIKKILVGKERELNGTFAQMASHYLFEVVACTPASGWEKGQVEKQVGDTRRNLFTPILKGNSFAEINAKLEEMCINWARSHSHQVFKDQSIYAVYEAEKSSLIPYRDKFSAYKLHPVVVSPLSLVRYDTNSYSVECAYVGLSVQIKATAWGIIILHKGKTIGQHQRIFEHHKQIYNPWHYVPALERKPGALRNGAPFKDLISNLPPPLKELRGKLQVYKDADKEFIAVLICVTKYGMDKVLEACTEVLKLGSCSSTLIRNYLDPQRNSEALDQVTTYPVISEEPSIDCTIYNQVYLTGGSNAIN